MSEQRPNDLGNAFAFFQWALTLDRERHVKRVGWQCIGCQANWLWLNTP